MRAVLHFDDCEETVKLMAEHVNLDIDWNIKNNQGQDAFTLALCKYSFNAKVIKILLNIPSLKPDVQLLRKMKVYEKASTQCHQFVSNKIISSGLPYSTGLFNVGNLYAFAFANEMKNIASVLIPDHNRAVETCRSLIAGIMSNDESLHPEDNVTELVYALRKGMDNLALVLASGVKVTDILLMCKIHQVEVENLRKAAEAQKIDEDDDSIPKKKIKLSDS